LNRLFIDTSFVIALLNEKDLDHRYAVDLSLLYEGFPTLITDSVLLEIGNSLARRFRQEAIQTINSFLLSGETEIIRLTPDLFDKAFLLYRLHKDKTWGLVDCVSFFVMKDRGVSDALTSDKHFQQAGFNALMRDD
jgi:uncharacterized protein